LVELDLVWPSHEFNEIEFHCCVAAPFKPNNSRIVCFSFRFRLQRPNSIPFSSFLPLPSPRRKDGMNGLGLAALTLTLLFNSQSIALFVQQLMELNEESDVEWVNWGWVACLCSLLWAELWRGAPPITHQRKEKTNPSFNQTNPTKATLNFTRFFVKWSCLLVWGSIHWFICLFFLFSLFCGAVRQRLPPLTHKKSRKEKTNKSIHFTLPPHPPSTSTFLHSAHSKEQNEKKRLIVEWRAAR